MYRPITMYQIVCDKCGVVFGGTETCSSLFSNKEVDIGGVRWFHSFTSCWP